jgi:hypothetical protein
VHPTRSGDVLFLLTHGTLLARDVAADHGTHHPEDRRVPLLLCGAGITRGLAVPGAAAPMDIAPTLARLAGLPSAELAGMDGHVLEAALAAPAAPAPAADAPAR